MSASIPDAGASATRTSRRHSLCPLCPHPIAPGESVLPTSLLDRPGAVDWAHAACLPVGSAVARPPCRHWRRLGRCPLRDAGEPCVFDHPPHLRGDSTDAGRKWGGRRRRVRNGHRNGALRAFLRVTYGAELLSSGAVLDVAAGRGELCWELANLSGCEAVAVEPRRIEVGRCSHRWGAGHYEPSRLGPAFARWNPAAEEGCSRRRDVVPAQIRCFFEAEGFGTLADAPVADAQAEAWFDAQRRRARDFRWTTKGCTEHHGDEREDELGEMADDLGTTTAATSVHHDIASAAAAREILRRTVLVVGMHPDQAAGEIAAYAHGRGIPWCVVPCCVYANDFPRRRLADGTRVTTHGHLVRWLCETYPGARTAVLDGVGGKNVVVYTVPLSQQPSKGKKGEATTPITKR